MNTLCTSLRSLLKTRHVRLYIYLNYRIYLYINILYFHYIYTCVNFSLFLVTRRANECMRRWSCAHARARVNSQESCKSGLHGKRVYLIISGDLAGCTSCSLSRYCHAEMIHHCYCYYYYYRCYRYYSCHYRIVSGKGWISFSARLGEHN